VKGPVGGAAWRPPHLIRVEEEPVETANQVSYRERTTYPSLGPTWSDTIKLKTI